MSEIVKWYENQYKIGVNIDLKGFPKKDIMEELSLSGIRRMSNFLYIKTMYPISSEGYTCIMLSAKLRDIDCNFGFLYWRNVDDESPEYLCIGNTFVSRDGEYRNNFMIYKRFAKMCELMSKEIEYFEEIVLELINDGLLELDTTLYCKIEGCEDKFSEKLNNSRIVIMIMSFILAYESFKFSKNIIHFHTNESFKKMMTSIYEMYKDMVSLSEKFIKIYKKHLNETYTVHIKCGQKIVPMHIREVISMYDYNFSVWREILVMQEVTNLVINFISPSFAIFNQWSYISNSDSDLFENSAMKELYTRSKSSEDITRMIRNTRDKIEDIDVRIKNYYTESLDARLYDDVEYSQSFLMLSDISILMVMEAVGLTFESVGNFDNGKEYCIMRLIQGNENLTKIIFELLYSSLCLHTKLGVIHTDLHINNMTFHKWGEIYRLINGKLIKNYENAKVLYKIRDSSFIFNANGISACIIDFSRCLLGLKMFSKIEQKHSATYAIHFYRDQVNRCMRTLHKYIPTFIEKFETQLKSLIMAKYEFVFPIICTIDYIAIVKNCKKLSYFSSIIPLLEEIEKLCNSFIIEELHSLIKGTEKKDNFFGFELLNKVFSKYKTAVEDIDLVDCYNYNNEMKYNSSDYETYPLWARFDEIEKHLGKYKMSDLFEDGLESFFDALQVNSDIEVIAEKLKHSEEMLDGKKISNNSSWLDI